MVTRITPLTEQKALRSAGKGRPACRQLGEPDWLHGHHIPGLGRRRGAGEAAAVGKRGQDVTAVIISPH